MPSLGHLYGEPYQALRRNRKPRDAAYHEKFRNPDRYTLSWVGPELSAGAGPLALWVRIDRFALDSTTAQDFNIWFTTTYLSAVAAVPGVLRVRRYLAMEGTPAHVVVHELADEAVNEHGAFDGLRRSTEDDRSGVYRCVAAATNPISAR
jgi:ketosteroid isomerase-like protein